MDAEKASDETHAGMCLCGEVRYQINGPLRDVVNCHCSRCRRHTGHFMAATAAKAEHVDITGDTLCWYSATAEVQYGFCGECGSTLFWRTERRPDLLSIAAGTLTPRTALTTVAAIYSNFGSDYHVYGKSIPTHGEDFPDK